MAGWTLAVCLVQAFAPSVGHGQSDDQSSASQDDDGLVFDSDFELDPIGVTADEQLDDVRPRRPDAGAPKDALPRIRPVAEGKVLTAIRAVQETQHRIAVRIDAGLAHVTHHLRFESDAQEAAEVAYRLAVPSEAVLAGLEVCIDEDCHSAAEPAGNGPPDHARAAYDAALGVRPPASQDMQAPAGRKAGDGSDTAGRAADRRADRRAGAVPHAMTILENGEISALAAPISHEHALELRIHYIAPVNQHGGVVRFALPARGMDARAAPAEVRVEAPGLEALHAPGDRVATPSAHKIPPWQGYQVHARMPQGTATQARLHTFACDSSPNGAGRKPARSSPRQPAKCARLYVASGAPAAEPRKLVLAIDASPSTEGPARNRIPITLATLLHKTPEASRIRGLAFAARARALDDGAKAPSEVSLKPLMEAVHEPLGAATRFEAVWDLVKPWLGRPRTKRAQRPLILLIGDGGITLGSDTGLEAAAGHSMEISVVNVSDRPTHPALRKAVRVSGGTNIEAGPEAEAALRGDSPDRLQERLSALFFPIVAGWPSEDGLRAGEGREHHFDPGKIPTLARLRRQLGISTLRPEPVPERWAWGWGQRARGQTGAALAAVAPRHLKPAAPKPAEEHEPAKGHEPAHTKAACIPQGSATEPADPGREPITLALDRGCSDPPPPPEPERTSMPSSPLLEMLRQRIIPIARGCFRRDRAGRGDYSVRAVFDFELADREVIRARIEGDITDKLRHCLLQAVDTLEIPRFTGTVRVRYPLTTERHPPPPVLELQEDTAGQVDAILDDGETLNEPFDDTDPARTAP